MVMTVYKNGKEIEKKSLVFRDGKEIGTDDLNLPRINVRGILFSFERSVTVGLSPSPNLRLKAVGFTLQSLTQFFVPDLSFCYRDLSPWWEIRTDQPGTQYHFIITDRLFLWCNAPISLSFFVSLCRKYCVLTVNFEK